LFLSLRREPVPGFGPESLHDRHGRLLVGPRVLGLQTLYVVEEDLDVFFVRVHPVELRDGGDL
jgi:hypothetical protein